MTGIIITGTVSTPLWISVPVVCCVACIVFRRAYIAVMLLGIATGGAVAEMHRPHMPAVAVDGREVTCAGVVKELRENDRGRLMVVEVDSVAGAPCRPFMAKCMVPSLMPYVDETFRMRFSATLRPLTSRMDLPDEIDYNSRLRDAGVTTEAFIVPDSIEYAVAEPGLFNGIRRLRGDVQAHIAVMPVSDGTRRFLTATLTGDRTWLDQSTREMFAATGIAHILALSGLHVGILTGLLTIMLMPLTMNRGRSLRMLLTVVALWAFAVMTGLSPSVVRAVIMATLFMVTTLMQRVWSPLNALGASALIILLFDPLAIYSLGFQLTFLAVLSIIVFADKLNPVNRRRRVMRACVGYVSVTVAAMLGTGMVSAWHFHIFPVGFLLVNMVVAVLLPPLLGGGVVLLLLNMAGIEARWFGGGVDMLYHVVETVARWVIEIPGAVVRDICVSGWMLVAYFLVLGLLAMWLHRRRMVWGLAMAMTVLCAVGVTLVVEENWPECEVYIPRSSTETTVVVKSGDRLLLATSARQPMEGDVLDRCAGRYGVYMMRRGIDGVEMMPEGVSGGRIARKGNVVFAGGKSFVLISANAHVVDYNFRPDYAVVCRGFMGDICEMAGVVGADSVLLSSDLNKVRHDRYAGELAGASVPYRSLRDGPWVMR